MGPPPPSAIAPAPSPSPGFVTRLANWWWDLSLRKKVLVLVAIPALAMVTPTAVTIALNQQQNSIRQDGRRWQELRSQVVAFDEGAESADLAINRFVVSGDADDLVPLDEFAATYEDDLAAVAATEPDELDDAIGRIERRAADLIATSQALREAAEAGDTVTPELIRDQQNASAELAAEVTQLLDHFDVVSRTIRDDVDDASRRVLKTLVIGIAISLAFSAVAMLLFVRSIVKRIHVMQQLAAHVLAGGELDEEIETAGDELGVLAAELAGAARLLIAAHQDAARSRDAALAATQQKDEFLSRMSHELRTPLTAILGFGQLLQMEDGLADDDREAVDQIVKAGRHLLELINDLLDISRIATGNLSLSLEPVVLAEVVDAVTSLLRPQATEKSVLVSNSVDPTLLVIADHQRLRQVLLNLVSNAIKYNSSPGTVVVSAERTVAGPDGTIVVSVTDSGPGISREGQSRLFQPFERLEATSTVEGTGVGLALTKSLVEAMGGTIGLDSVVGRGSRFWVELHAAEATPVTAAMTARSAPPPREERAPDGATVLYVEDNLANVRVVERFLAGRGIHLEVAMQGGLALQIARDAQPRVILLDVHLPDMNGADVLQALKGDERTASIPVVVLSADATEGGQRRFLDAGALEYLTKPIDLERLGGILDELTPSTA